MPNAVAVPVPLSTSSTYLLTRTIVDLLITTAQSSSQTTPQPLTDLEVFERAIKNITSMLDRVLVYVRSVLSGEVEGDPAIGRYLMDTLGTSTEGLEKGGFNANLQVCVKKMSFIASD